MSRNKKILIGVGIVVLLGAVVFANVKFKKTNGAEVNVEAVQKRRLEAIVSASGKIQPRTLVNISADTMGRVTGLAVNEGDRVQGDSSCSRSTRGICARVSRAERPRCQAARVAGRTAAARARERRELTLKRQRTITAGSRSSGRAG